MLKIDKSIELTFDELLVAFESLKQAPEDPWDGPTGVRTGLFSERAELKNIIKRKLLQIHGNVCIYCGLIDANNSFVVEHFAPKNVDSYPEFTFTSRNLLLACWNCNNAYKKAADTIKWHNDRYDNCNFSMYHPRLHEISDHFYVNAQAPSLNDIIIPKSPEGQRFFDIFELDRRLDLIMRNYIFLKNGDPQIIEAAQNYINTLRTAR
nr:hypothetical protein [uncultured Bdellovibrio sp.]